MARWPKDRGVGLLFGCGCTATQLGTDVATHNKLTLKYWSLLIPLLPKSSSLFIPLPLNVHLGRHCATTSTDTRLHPRVSPTKDLLTSDPDRTQL